MANQLSLFDFGGPSSSSGGANSTPLRSKGASRSSGQQELDLGLPINSRQFEPAKTALEGASRYTHGRHSIEGLENTHVDRFRAYKTQAAYQVGQKQPESPNIRKSYNSFRNDVNKQYDFMTKPKEAGGMGMKHEIVNEDPYDPHGPQGVSSMAKDVEAGRIKTLATAVTGNHNFLSPEENDRFRAVHDVFGHAATGRGFDAHGEEAAFLSHRQMFSKKALPALASETRGQNSYMNYGPGGFPKQDEKLISLPPFASRA
jgi:hypothetical protein